MVVDVIVLNGGSSSGKSSLAICLQQRLEGNWLTLGVDDLIRALSHSPGDTSAGGTLSFESDGSIEVRESFRRAERAWHQGIAAMAHAGAKVIVDEVFLDGGRAQDRLLAELEGLTVVWVGVQCEPDVAEAREAQRAERITGMARDQATRVHTGMRYDLTVNTTRLSSEECAAIVVEYLAQDHGAP